MKSGVYNSEEERSAEEHEQEKRIALEEPE